MVRNGKIIWTETARKEFKATCAYWNKRNSSTAYAKRLHKLLQSTAEKVLHFPKSGIPTPYRGVRFVVVRDYLLFYTEVNGDIILLSFWDGRQDPEKLQKRLT